MTPTLAEILATPTMLGADPSLQWADLRHTIEHAIRNDPRSLQKRIGPSEVGHPCDRRLSYHLAGVHESQADGVNWKATIGRAVHAWLEGVFRDANDALVAAGLGHRFLVEQRVVGGTLNGEDIDGSTDLFDIAARTVVDWKVTTKKKIASYVRHGPGAQYEVQGQSYGAGWERRGVKVDRIAIVFLPRDGELAEGHMWSAPYDATVAPAAFARLGAISLAVRTLGPKAHELMATADAYCRFCPWYRAGSADIAQACPGDPHSTAGAASAAMQRDPFA